MADQTIPDWAQDPSLTAAASQETPKARAVGSIPDWAQDPAPAATRRKNSKTSTDWLPDFIQGSVKRAGLALGLIDPKTYYGLGNYGENARATNKPTTVSNPAVPGFVGRAVRSAGENFSPAGYSVASTLKRANADVRDDAAIRDYGAKHNWTGKQIDAAIARARQDRADAIKEQRQQQAIRDADEARREDGGEPTLGGIIKRGAANLVGGTIADGPLILAAPEIKGAAAIAPVVGRVAGKIAKSAAPVIERFVTKVAPSAAGQAVVQGAADVASQISEVQAGIEDHYDPVQTVVRTSLGAVLPVAGYAAKPVVGSLAKGAGKVAGKLADTAGKASDALSSRFNGTVSKTYTRLADEAENLAKIYETNGNAAAAASARRSVEVYRTKAQEVSSTNPALPAGMTPRDVARATKQLAGIQLEANNFKGTPEPRAEDVFPTEASRAADAEAWGKSLGAPEPAPVEPPAAPVEPAPAAEPAISKKEADALFKEATGKPETQTPAQWGKSLEQQAAEWEASREAGNTKPAPSPATRNAVAEAPPAEAVPVEAGATAKPAEAASQDDVVARLTNALSTAGRAREEQTVLYKQERSRRVAKAGQAIDSLTGEDAINASAAALKGEMPKADFESVASQFTQADVKSLQERIRTADTLTVFGKQKAWSGLRKLMHGEIPQGSELKELSQVFPQDFIKAALDKRSTIAKSRNTIQEVWNLPKSLMSTADLSAPLRQGIGLIHRKEWRDSFTEMHKYLTSPKAFDELETGIRKSKYYAKMEEGGLSLPGVYDTAQEVEDAFSSHLAQKLFGIKHINKASERAYVGFLNKLRADTFSNMLDTAASKGLDIDDPNLLKSLARVVNTATGRGSLGKFERASQELNMIFFSPRLIKARIETFTNPFDPRLHPFARKEAIKSFAATGTYWATMAGLATMAGYSVETDPRSSDFMKAKKGNQRLDFSGGYGPLVVVGARYLKEQAKYLKTGDIRDLKRGGDTAEDAVIKFFRNKLSPTASLIVDAKTGENAIGEKFEWGPALASRATPLSLPDILLTLHEDGIEGVPVSVLLLYGVGVQDFNENEGGQRVMDYPYPFGKAPTPAISKSPATDVINTSIEIPDWAKE